MDPADAHRPGIRDARESLESIRVVQQRREGLTPPPWLYWGLGTCMVVEGLAHLFAGAPRIVGESLVLVAALALSLAAQRRTGVVSRMTQPPRRPAIVWIVVLAIVIVGVLLTSAADRVGLGPLSYFVVALLIVAVGPRLHALLGRLA